MLAGMLGSDSGAGSALVLSPYFPFLNLICGVCVCIINKNWPRKYHLTISTVLIK